MVTRYPRYGRSKKEIGRTKRYTGQSSTGTTCASYPPNRSKKLEARPKGCSALLDIASEWRADVAGKHDCAAGCGVLQDHTTAGLGVVGIGIFRKVPIRIKHLQQVVKDVARDHRAAAAGFNLKHEMPRRVARRRRNFDEFIETVRPGYQICAAGFDHRQDAFAERTEFGRRGRRIVIDILEIVEIYL